MIGCLAIFISKAGDIVASSQCFDNSRYGGHSIEESQRIKSKTKLKRLVVEQFANNYYVEDLSYYTIDRIIDDLLRAGARIYYETIKIETNQAKSHE